MTNGPGSHEITATLASFIRQYTDSVDKLELLTSMIESPDRWWDAASAAQMLGTTAGVARRILERFAAQNLLEIRVTGDVRYRYQPGDPQLEATGCEFAAAYRANRLAVLRLVTGERERLRDFADAFRIRTDDDR
jgi:hypothetical protein